MSLCVPTFYRDLSLFELGHIISAFFVFIWHCLIVFLHQIGDYYHATHLLSSIRLKEKDSTCGFEKNLCFLLRGSIVSEMAQTLKHKRQCVVTIFQIE
jgi:hypothetical protein